MTEQKITGTEVQVEVGDFFVESWGYDQTNINFYKVVGLTPSGASVKVQEWSSKIEGEVGGPQEYVVPGEGPRTRISYSDQERVDAPIKTKRLLHRGNGKPNIKVRDWGSWASLWNGKAVYQTGSGWGH